MIANIFPNMCLKPSAFVGCVACAKMCCKSFTPVQLKNWVTLRMDKHMDLESAPSIKTKNNMRIQHILNTSK